MTFIFYNIYPKFTKDIWPLVSNQAWSAKTLIKHTWTS